MEGSRCSMCAMAKEHELVDADGRVIPGFFVGARPQAIILVHEIYGLNAQIRGVANRYAVEGFTTFAIDLFGGRVTDDDAAGYQLAYYLQWKPAIERIRAAVRALARLAKDKDAKVGIV